MIEWLVEPFLLGFQQRALIGGILAAVAMAIVGTWVVIRGMAFLGDALVHGVVPGVALAVLVGFNVVVGAALAAVVMIGGINLVHKQTRFNEDTAIGLLFVGMLGLGVILISRTKSYTAELTSILFGDALGVTRGDLIGLAVIAVLAVVASWILYRPLLVLAFNADKAELLGMRPVATNAALLTLVTLVIVGSFQTVGTLLVLGLLVGPPATAALLVRRVPTMMVVAAGIGAGSVLTGLFASYYLDTSASATMAIVPVLLFFVVLAARGGSPTTPTSA